MESSPRKLEIAQMDRETLNNLYYSALELIDDLEVYIKDIIKKTNISDSRLETSIPNLSESMVMVTPEPPKLRGILRRPKNWPQTQTPQTPPESRNLLFRYLDKPDYIEEFKPITPLRTTRNGGKRGKNIRKNKTMRKYSKK